jgi:hypothetical protein
MAGISWQRSHSWRGVAQLAQSQPWRSRSANGASAPAGGSYNLLMANQANVNGISMQSMSHAIMSQWRLLMWWPISVMKIQYHQYLFNVINVAANQCLSVDGIWLLVIFSWQ